MISNGNVFRRKLKQRDDFLKPSEEKKGVLVLLGNDLRDNAIHLPEKIKKACGKNVKYIGVRR